MVFCWKISLQVWLNRKRAFLRSKICGVTIFLSSKAPGVPHKWKLCISEQKYTKIESALCQRFPICNASTFILVNQHSATSMETQYTPHSKKGLKIDWQIDRSIDSDENRCGRTEINWLSIARKGYNKINSLCLDITGAGRNPKQLK